MIVDHVVFLIHPCCYEVLEPEQIRKDGLQLFLDREEQVKARWLDEIGRRGSGTFFVQLGGPGYLRDAAAAALGESMCLLLQTPYSATEGLHAYYRSLTDEIQSHLSAEGLELDTATVSSELWGESFEGCVPGYGGAFATYLGLRQAPQMRFEMTVFDSRFLHQARSWETIAIPDCDVEAWLFECHDGTSAATFQPRQTAQWLDARRVHLRLDDRRVQVCDKQGHTVWPAAPWTKGKPETVCDYALPMQEFISRWVRSVGMAIDDFRPLIAAARIDSAAP